MTTTCTAREIDSQPEVWRRALTLAEPAAAMLRRPGEKILIIGCGTSAFIAHSLAELREHAGLGESHWAYASEMPTHRSYDHVIAISRSGTTTEVLDALRRITPTTPMSAICGVHDSPLTAMTEHSLVLDFADEQSVVQTRFPTTVLALAARVFGTNVEALAESCSDVLSSPLPVAPADFEHFVFLGRGWTQGLANEAALKIREAAQAWSESHPAMDYRHGPIAVAGPSTLVWIFGEAPPGLVDDLHRVGATVVTSELHPLVQLVQAQRLAVVVATARGLDPDSPRHLTRSVVL